MGQPEGLKRTPFFRSRPAASVAAALLLFTLLLFSLFPRVAKEVIERALGEGSSIAGVALLGPTRLALLGFEANGVTVDEVLIEFSLGKAFREGVEAGLLQIDLVRPKVEMGSAGEGTPGAWPHLPPVVRVVDGALVAGGTVLLRQIDAVVVKEGDRLRGEGELRGLSLGGLRVDEAAFDASVHFESTGPATVWRGALTLRQGKGIAYHHPFSSLQVEATGGPSGWEIREIALTGADGARARGEGRLDVSGGLRVALALEVEEVPARAGLRWITGDEAILRGAAGTLGARLELTGPASSLEIRGVLESEGLRIHGAMLSDFTGGFVRTPDGAVSARAKGMLGGGLVELERVSWRDDGVEGALRFEAVGAPALVRAVEAFAEELPPLGRLSGRVNGRLELGGRPGALEVSGTLDAERLRWSNVPLEPVQVEGGWSEEGWEIRRASALLGEDGPLLTGKAAGRGTDAEASVRFRELPIEWLRRLWGAPLLPGLSGVAEGSLSLTRSGHTLRLNGEAGVRGEVEGTPLEGEVEGSVVHGGAWSLRGMLLASDGSVAFSGSGSAEGAAEIQGSVERFPAEVAAGLWALGSLAGVLDGGADWHRDGETWSLRGSLASPELDLEGFRLTDANLRFDLGPSPSGTKAFRECPACLFGEAQLSAGLLAEGSLQAERASLVAEFLGDRVQLRPASLRLWGGRITLEGSARLNEEEWIVDFRSLGQGLAFQREGVAADLGYDVELEGPLDALRLSGSVDVAKGELDLFSLGRRPGGGSAIPVDLDLDLRLKSARVRARSLLDSELAGELALKGTLGRPALQGELALLRSSFWYLGSRFRAEGGSLTFTGAGLIPRLSVIGELTKPGRRVYALVEGPAEALEISLSSDPPMGEREILELIGVPTQWSLDETGGWAGLVATLATWVDRELVSDVYWRLGSALEEKFDLDAFQIESNKEGGARLLLGKYVTPELYLSYDWELKSGSTGGIGLEYALTPFVRLKSAWSRARGTEVGIAATLSF